jgi:hypothetical protein
VPVLLEDVVQLYVIVPDAPATRLNGLGLVLRSEQPGDGPNPPDNVAVGGLGLATMPLCVATEMFFTVITMRNVVPAAIADTAVPEVSVVWKPVICSDCKIHEIPAGAVVVMLVRLVMPSAKFVSVV